MASGFKAISFNVGIFKVPEKLLITSVVLFVTVNWI